MQRLRNYAISFLHNASQTRALGAGLGTALGMQPLYSLQGALLLLALLVVRANLLWTVASVLIGTFFGWMMSDTAEGLGNALLTLPSLRYVFAYFFHAPIVPFTRFNETRVIGAAMLLPFLGAAVAYASGRWGALIHNAFPISRYRIPPDSVEPTWFRPHAFRVVGGSVAALVVLSFFTISNSVKTALEHFGSKLNSGPVTIGKLDLDLWNQSVRLSDVRIAHHVRTDRDRIRIARAEVRFQSSKLLAKKLILEALQVSGVQLDLPRETALENPIALDPASVSVFDRVDDRLYGPLATYTSNSTLTKVGFLSSALPIQERLTALRGKLQTIKELQALEQFVDDTLAARTQRGVASDLPAARNLSAQLAQVIRTALPQDVKLVRQTLGLPETEEKDLSLWLFGPKSLNYLGRISYWIDLSRRRMPKGSRKGVLSISHQSTDWGTSYHFGKNAALPAFLLKHATLKSDFDPSAPNQPWIRAELSWLSTDPYLTGHPLKFHGQAKLMDSTPHTIELKGEIDHTAEQSNESITVRLAEFPLREYVIHDSAGFSIFADRARLSAEVKAVFEETHSKINWYTRFRDLQLKMRTRHRVLENALSPIVGKRSALDIKGELVGQTGDYTLEITSEFGSELASALHHGLRHELGAVDDTIRQSLLDTIEPIRLRLAGKMQKLDPSPN